MNNSELSLDQIPITALKGVGASLAAVLAKLEIFSVQDLLFHLPFRYVDRTRVTPIGALRPLENVVIEGEVRACDIVFGKRRSLLVKLQDGTGTTSLRFYHFNSAQKNRLIAGVKLRVFGETRRGSSGLEFYHPEYDVLDENKSIELAQHLTPIYPVTEGLSQLRIRSLATQALNWLDTHLLRELLPDAVRTRLNQVSLVEALKFLHQPPPQADIAALMEGAHPFQERLAFEELLAHHLSLLVLRQRVQAEPATPLHINKILQKKFLSQLPFSPTAAQVRVANEIFSDLEKSVPMLRLVQGDVGSGKTLVAALAALAAVSCGKQVAIMAPTEILAEQHLASFSRWFEPLGIQLACLLGKQKVAQRRENLQLIESGDAQIVVGTHALFQDAVTFANLALIVIDEQHRFGVQQRLSLAQKGFVQTDDLPTNTALEIESEKKSAIKKMSTKNNSVENNSNKNELQNKSQNKSQHESRVHQLIMTATPIPRTLAMSIYADLDCSVIDELPPGRTPIETIVVSDVRREEVIERVRTGCEQGRQAYWVCTLIEESEALEAQAAEATTEQLREALPHLRVGLVHGRLKPAEKTQIMAQFKNGDLDLLVATTVIEVGVDVPNASLMIIENPERLGLAQLHQLRGRVGRGSTASHCVLLYASPLSQHSKARLQVMRESSDGFYIAEQDLKLRGPGQILGTQQTGELNFKIADLMQHAHWLEKVKMSAEWMMRQNCSETDLLIQRWLGNREIYLQV